MPRKTGLTRRQFLAATTAAVAAPMIIPARAMGLDGNTVPSERINVGFVGCGAMNSGHIRTCLDNAGTHVLAVCDVNAQKRAEARGGVERHYAALAGTDTYTGCTEYNDFREMVANPDIDAVYVATPEHMHALPALAALRAGKDVFIEKPMTLTIEEGRKIADEVKSRKAVFHYGTQQRSYWEFGRAVELVRNGRIGKLKSIDVILFPGGPGGACTPQDPPEWFDYELWLGPAPWTPYCPEKCLGVRAWSYIRDYSGGRITEWGSHHLDIAQWALDADYTGPSEIEGTGTFPDTGVHNMAYAWDLILRYPSGQFIRFTDGGREERLPGEHGDGVRFIGEEGQIVVNRDTIKADPEGILESEIGPDELHLRGGGDHYQNFFDCIRSRQETVCPVEVAQRSNTLSHLSNICLELGRKLRWNPETERFIDDPEADALISRPMRAPWTLDA
jgi:predicted dehydrogenase